MANNAQHVGQECAGIDLSITQPFTLRLENKPKVKRVSISRNELYG